MYPIANYYDIDSKGELMTTLVSALKHEITRLARKEARAELAATRKAASRHRGEIAALKRQIAELTRELRTLRAQVQRGGPKESARANGHKQLRFSPAWLRTHREKLQVSAEDYGRLVGVSAMSVYNWEHGRAKPQRKQLEALAAVRSLGKREAWKKLDQLDGA